ncbi:MAG: hypothetical protein LBU47_00660 [Christensenellaceae bacterium]|jgi:phage shock protein A|nr:hypothetical protein [Christensenellaceae bacterium]
MTEREARQIESIRDKLAELKARQNAILARDKKRQRQERTRRLIKLGSLVEKYIHCENMELVEAERILQALTNSNGAPPPTPQNKTAVGERNPNGDYA